ncbi:MAG: DUF4082 domain-containing protein [Chloracidobacterium sp.]|nr:DUF4082 domain-containing protein [Chloracidobacterium sp.]
MGRTITRWPTRTKAFGQFVFGNATGDPQPDWVDFNKIQIPQADEQQRLLANAITLGIQHRKPLPRFWYFPRGEKAVVVMTGDDHASNGTPGQFDWDIAQSPSGCNVADWECIRGTSYIFNNTGIGVANAVSYEAQGFEIALHVSTNCEDFTSQAHLAGFFTSHLATFATNFPDVAAPSTSRTHCIAWSDWVSEAKVAYSNGIRLDTNYYYWPASWVLDRPGHFTGSGMPMRFADLDGSMIDVYQAATQMTDESGINYTTHINTLLGNATGPLGYYGVVTANMHTDTGPHPGQIVIVNAAKAMGVPVVSARQLLTWLDGRNGSSFGSVSWSGNSLNFSVAVGSGANGLQVMLPIQSAVGPLGTITFGGNPVTYTAQTIKGINYAVFNAQPGAYVADYSPDTTPPTVQSVTPGDAATNVAASANVTAVFSESLDPLTVGAATFELTDPSNALVTATVTYDDLTRTATLNPSLNLAYSTTYTAKLIGGSTGIKDSAGNPLALDYVWSFTTAAAPPCFVDDTTVDFALGTTGSSTSVTTTGNGEVTLKSTVENFDTFPSTTNWQSFPWSSGGTSTVSGGKLNIDGARFNTEPTTTTYGPGTTIEFAATFAAASFQHIGFGKGTDEVEPGPGIYNTSPMAAFSTGGGTSVITRVWPEGGGGFIDYPIPSSLTGTQHLYRIEWTATTIDFYVDGLLVNSQASVITSPMRPAANDYTVGGLSLQLDWIGISPSTYATTGSFTSRVFDGGAETTWGAMDWTSTLPTGTSLAMYYRTGSTPTPDGSWTDFYTVATSGTSLGTTSRYIQYRADLATTAPGSTPVLSYVSIGCDGIATASGPIISNILAMPGVDGTSATITWTTDIASTSTVDYGVSTGGLIPVTNANLVTSHSVNLTGLNPSTIYYYRVTSVDGTSISSSSPQSPSTLNFTTSALPGSCPCSIWDDTSGVGVNGNDASPYELGVKFRSSLAGFITGVRFYKYSSNTGTHTGHLWDINGNLLGSATFTNEAVSGWQEVSFASPVAISANTVYVASYSTTTGNYAFSGGYFTSQGVDNGPLHALSASESPNGVLNTSPGQFPNLTFNDANYWVDAVFDTMDIVPPAISNVAAMPGSNGTTATITWTTDELADSRVDYGTSPASLNLNSIDAGQTTTHSIDLNGLTPGQTYYFRVTSKDGSNNSATSPESPAEPLQFSTNGLTITDTTVADFGAASSDTCYVSNTSGGEVILPPTLAAEFSGAVLPAGWADYAWTGGISTVAGGKVSVNGSRLNQSDTTGFTAGRSLEFVATFKSVTYQNIGFAAGDNDTAEPSSGALADGTQPWAMFGKSTATDHIFSRINSTGTSVDVDLGPVTEAPHLYKIEWLADNTVNFFIDGVLKDSRLASFGAVLMRSVISDYANDGTTLDVDWMRMSPYVSPCTFTSRVFDAGTPVVWDQMTWNGSTPAGTSLAMSYRIGNSPTPDGMWSGFVPASVSPATLAGNARYIQYQAILATSDANQTPTLTDVNITYSSGTDSSPPIITDRSPLPNAVNVNVGTNIGVTFSEPMNSSTITAGNFRMHRNGDAGDTPATLIVTGNSATLDPTTDLQPFSTYTVYADSGITDVTGNPLTPESWVYTTAAPILSATDTTTADFTAGTTNCVVDPLINDGALRQATTLEEEFSGATLPGGWSSTPWTGGTSSVSGGVLSVDGSLAFTNDLYGPGRSIEFVATFGTSSFQHAGLGVDMNTTPLWAVFSTKDTSNSLYARTNNNGSTADTLIPGSWLGTPHRFRIDWYANSIVFSIDGTIVHVEVVSIANNMRPVVSDYNFGEPALTVDWLRMSPYATPCTFTSRVIDAGSVVDWLDLTSTGTTPTGTSVGFETRSGNATDTNDSSWSSWEAVNSPIASPNSRYIQYRSTLANTDDTQTPVVESVNITYQNQPTFTLTYDANGGSGSPPVDGTAYAYNASVTVASQGSLVRTGYSFAGWNTAANGSGTQFAAGGSFNIVASTSVYAKCTAASQTLTFNSNGGSAVTAITQDFGTAVSAPADPTRTGYTFAGWYTDDGTFLNAYTFSTMGVSTTIHAKWTAVSQTLTFNSNGGSAATAITQDFGTAISAPADPTKAGYTFAGWYNEAGLTTPHVFDFMGLSTTVYAKWTIVEYTISGKVLTPGNAGLVNVMMTLTGDSGGSATTDANGNYSIDGITPGGNYVVTPSLSGYTFVPATRSYTSLSADVSNADFTGYGGGFESDVALPNDGQVSVTDYTRTGSLAVGLATPDPLTNEFQRADSAPRATRGDGLITAADYVQAGRYAAGIDNVQPAGGTPFASLFSVQEMIKEQEDNQRALLPRVVSVIDTSGYAGQQVVVSIKVEASGDESGFGFTVSYDGTKLSDPFVMTGADMPFSAPIINTQTAGKVGVITASPFGATMPFGSREIVKIRFNILPTASGGPTSITFTGAPPVVNQVSSAAAEALPTTFTAGTVTILSPTAIGTSVGGIVLSPGGQAVRNARLSMTDQSGMVRTVVSNSFGFFRFDDVTVGETYVIDVRAKGLHFAPQVVSVADEITDLIIVAEP